MTAETIEKSLSEPAPLVTASNNDDRMKDSTEEKMKDTMEQKVHCEHQAENLTAAAEPDELDKNVDVDGGVEGEEMPDVSVEDVVEEKEDAQPEVPTETPEESNNGQEDTTGLQVISDHDDGDEGKSEIEKSVEKADSPATGAEKLSTNDAEESEETKNEKVLEEVTSVNLEVPAPSGLSSGEASPDHSETVVVSKQPLNKPDDDKAESTTASPKPTIDAKKRLSPDPPQGVPDAKKIAASSENDVQE